MGGTHLQFQCKQTNVGDSAETNLIRFVNNQCHRRQTYRSKDKCDAVCFVRSPTPIDWLNCSLLNFGVFIVICKMYTDLDCDCTQPFINMLKSERTPSSWYSLYISWLLVVLVSLTLLMGTTAHIELNEQWRKILRLIRGDKAIQLEVYSVIFSPIKHSPLRSTRAVCGDDFSIFLRKHMFRNWNKAEHPNRREGKRKKNSLLPTHLAAIHRFRISHRRQIRNNSKYLMRNYSVVLVLFFGELLLCSGPSKQRHEWEKNTANFPLRKMCLLIL